MVDLMHCLANLLFFDIPLLYYYVNLNSSISTFFFLKIYIFLLVFLFHSHLFLNAILLKYCVEILKHLLIFHVFYFQLNRLSSLQFFELLSLKQILLHVLQIFQSYQELFNYTYCSYFQQFQLHVYQYFRNDKKSRACYIYLQV